MPIRGLSERTRSTLSLTSVLFSSRAKTVYPPVWTGRAMSETVAAIDTSAKPFFLSFPFYLFLVVFRCYYFFIVIPPFLFHRSAPNVGGDNNDDDEDGDDNDDHLFFTLFYSAVGDSWLVFFVPSLWLCSTDVLPVPTPAFPPSV